MDTKVETTIANFRSVFFEGVPLMLRQNETAFLSYLCVCAAIDALSGYRFAKGQGKDVRNDGERFARFVREYFRAEYADHADHLYILRCRALHNFSPAKFTLAHARPELHLQPSPALPDVALDDVTFFEDMRAAAEKLFAEINSSPVLEKKMLERLNDVDRGGAIFFLGG